MKKKNPLVMVWSQSFKVVKYKKGESMRTSGENETVLRMLSFIKVVKYKIPCFFVCFCFIKVVKYKKDDPKSGLKRDTKACGPPCPACVI